MRTKQQGKVTLDRFEKALSRLHSDKTHQQTDSSVAIGALLSHLRRMAGITTKRVTEVAGGGLNHTLGSHVQTGRGSRVQIVRYVKSLGQLLDLQKFRMLKLESENKRLLARVQELSSKR